MTFGSAVVFASLVASVVLCVASALTTGHDDWLFPLGVALLSFAVLVDRWEARGRP